MEGEKDWRRLIERADEDSGLALEVRDLIRRICMLRSEQRLLEADMIINELLPSRLRQLEARFPDYDWPQFLQEQFTREKERLVESGMIADRVSKIVAKKLAQSVPTVHTPPPSAPVETGAAAPEKKPRSSALPQRRPESKKNRAGAGKGGEIDIASMIDDMLNRGPN